MSWIEKQIQPQLIELKSDSQINQEHRLKQGSDSHENICLKEELQNNKNSRLNADNGSILSRNKFMRLGMIVLILVLVFVILILTCLDCAFNRQILSKEENTKIQKILNSQTKISDHQLNQDKQIEDQNQNLNHQVENINKKIQGLQSMMNQLQHQLHQQKSKQNELHQDQTKEKSNKTKTNNKLLPASKFTIRQNQRKNIPATSNNDLYEFNMSIDQIVHRSSMKVIYRNKNISQGIQMQTFQRAIRLMEVTHNINIKGEFLLDHFKFYRSGKHKYEALSKLLDREKQYYDKKYETTKYIHDQIGMCIFVQSNNNAHNRLYLRNLDSIFQQDYQNYHLVYVNDASVNETRDYVLKYMEENQIPKQKYTIINNQKRQFYAANLFMAAHHYCQLGEIMVFLNGDDAFIGRQVLSLLNAVYQKEKVALTYGSFLEVEKFKVTKGHSQQISSEYLEKGQIRQTRTYFTSHLKTMYVDVMKSIKKTDLEYENGTFYTIAAEVAFMTTAIQLVGTRLKFLQELIYEYRSDSQVNDMIKEQKEVQNDVWTKQPSLKLINMSFADQPKTIHYL